MKYDFLNRIMRINLLNKFFFFETIMQRDRFKTFLDISFRNQIFKFIFLITETSKPKP